MTLLRFCLVFLLFVLATIAGSAGCLFLDEGSIVLEQLHFAIVILSWPMLALALVELVMLCWLYRVPLVGLFCTFHFLLGFILTKMTDF